MYMRFLQTLKLDERIAHARLLRRCFIDYDREMVLVAEILGVKGEGSRLAGIGRLSKLHGIPDAEFAILVSDSFQRQGLGAELTQRLIRIARDEHLERIHADILPTNNGMLTICRKLGFTLSQKPADNTVRAQLKL